MDHVVNISPELSKRLHDEAKEKGISFSDYVKEQYFFYPLSPVFIPANDGKIKMMIKGKSQIISEEEREFIQQLNQTIQVIKATEYKSR